MACMAESSGLVVLSFYDSLLHESDVFGLQPSEWLNDKVIEFMYE